MRRTFASDNNAGVHPNVLAAIARANEGHTRAYGEDAYTRAIEDKIRALLGRPDAEVFFVFNGTGANVLGLSTLARPHDAILCAEGAHVATDEANAPERFVGAKLVTIRTPDGKLTPDLVEPHVKGVGIFHHAQPRVVSITQSSELGTVYSKAELATLRSFCDGRGLFLHVDGARIANAAAALGGSIRDATHGADVLSFGGTKNGALAAEAVVFLRPGLARDFLWTRKQGMQLASKMRYLAAQFDALLHGDLWLENARHANRMAALLSKEVSAISGVSVALPTQANAVFATMPRAAIAPLLDSVGFFELWDERTDLVRWVCSWDTTDEDVRGFLDALRRVLAKVG